MPSQVGGEMSLMDLGRYAGKAGKKAAEMSRFLQVNGCVSLVLSKCWLTRQLHF